MPQPVGNRWVSLFIVLIGFFMILVDTTIVNVSIPTIIRELHASLTDIEWIISGYSLTFAALLITFGRLGDLYGRKLLFMLGLVVFTVASFFSGGAQTATVLIVARLFQGVGGAMLSPATLSIISSTFQGKERAAAFGAFGATSGIAAAVGPVMGGWLTAYHSWRWIFRVNIPIGIIGLVLAALYVRDSKNDHGEKIDFSGMLTSSLGFFFLVFALIEGQNYGWLKPAKDFAVAGLTWGSGEPISIIAVSLILAFVFLAAFIGIQAYKTRLSLSPAVNLGFFKYRTFRYGLVAIGIIALGEFSSLFTLPIFLQSVKGFTPLQSGYATLPLALSSMIAAPLSAKLVNRLGSKWIITTGISLETLGLFLLSRLDVDTSYRSLVPALLCLGFGLGLAISQNTQVILSEIEPRLSGSASGTLNTVRQIGTALGIAVVGAVLSHQSTVLIPRYIRDADLPGLPADARAQIADAATQGGGGYTTGSADTSQYVPTPPPAVAANPALRSKFEEQVALTQANLKRAIYTGLSQSISRAIEVGAAFMLLGALLSLLIPNVAAYHTKKEEA